MNGVLENRTVVGDRLRINPHEPKINSIVLCTYQKGNKCSTLNILQYSKAELSEQKVFTALVLMLAYNLGQKGAEVQRSFPVSMMLKG